MRPEGPGQVRRRSRVSEGRLVCSGVQARGCSPLSQRGDAGRNGIRDLLAPPGEGMASQTTASWNQTLDWLREMALLKNVARPTRLVALSLQIKP